LWTLTVPAYAAITFGQLDNFQDGTTQGWDEGAASPNPPANVADGGPRGAGDAYLQNVSGGVGGAGGKMVMFSGSQWAGNYNAAGVTQIDASVANLGAEPLFMRLAVLSGTAVYGSAEAVELPPDGVWRRVTFGLTGDALTKLEGTDTLAEALSHVQNLRVLSAQGGPALMGDVVAGTLGLDDVRALRLPGDANFDGRVDAADFRVARLAAGNRGVGGWARGDFDFDGRVTARDLALLRRHFGQSIPVAPPAAGAARASLAVVPEPGTGAAATSLLLLLLRRRRASYHNRPFTH
jgi:hypothetical protein